MVFFSGLEKKLKGNDVLVIPCILQELSELHFQPVFIINDDTKRNKNENSNLRLFLVLKTIFSTIYGLP